MLIHALYALALSVSPYASSLPNAPGAVPVEPTASASDSAPLRRTTFGVAIAPVPERIRAMPYLEENEGVVVTEVRAGGAAEAAALRVGDIILGIDGQRVDETTLFATIRTRPRNQAFRVEYLRDGKWKETWARIER